MAIWTRTPNLDQLMESSRNTAVSHMGIEYLEVGDDYVTGRMPVDERTVQPFGILHGGASVVLAETLGSMAANCCLKDPETVALIEKAQALVENLGPQEAAKFYAEEQRKWSEVARVAKIAK